MKQIQIQVFSSVDSRLNNKVLFERIIDVNDSLDVPYSSLVRDLKFMFGASSVVTFAVL